MAKLGKRKNSIAPESQVEPKVLGAGESRTLAACIKRPKPRPRTEKKYSASYSSIPRDIIFNVLLLLPASFLQDIVRLVCKEWNAIITDPLFVKAHLLHSLSSPATSFLIQDEGLLDAKLRQAFYIHTDDATPRYTSSELKLPFKATIMGSCHGLVLLHHATIAKKLLLVNLVTKAIISLPPLNQSRVRILRTPVTTLAFAPASGQYKVVYVSFASKNKRVSCADYDEIGFLLIWKKIEVKVFVCTVAVDKTWRAIDCKGITTSMEAKNTLLNKPLSTAEGYIYWLDKRYNNGVALDIDTETMYQFPNPNDYVKNSILTSRSINMDTGVGMVHRQSPVKCWKVWKMIEPKTGTWTRAMDFDSACMYLRLDSHFNPFAAGNCEPLFISLETGEVWLFCNVNRKHVVVCYNWKTGKVWSAPYKWPEGVSLPHLHLNSLLSLKNL